MKLIRTTLLAALVPLGLMPQTNLADVDSDLDAAKNSLFNGRNYLVGFPDTKTRNNLRQDYLSVGANGQQQLPYAPKYPLLKNAVDLAVKVRTDPVEAFAASSPQIGLAQTNAWEALEAMLQGQLIAGNGNFLKGLRVAFPTTTPETPGGDSAIPVGCPGPYNGANITDLCYAQLHFVRGVIGTLDFMASDSEGKIRSSEPGNSPFFQYTYFNTPALPDPLNFGPSARSSQTAGYLLGNILDRYGKCAVAIGDRLWRGAYFDKNRAPGGSRSYERQDMLDHAIAQLQRGIHSQFLAALPLAATLDDGETVGLRDEYQLCRIDQVRVSAATAASFIEHIRHGDIPKLDNLTLNSSTDDIHSQISYVNTLKTAAANKYGTAKDAIWRQDQSVQAKIADAITIHDKIANTLFALITINVGTESTSPYFALSTSVGRANFASDLKTKIEQMLNADITSPLLTTSGDLGTAILQMRRAFADIESARNRIATIPQQVRIEEERVGAVNGVIIGTANQISAYQLAMGIANSVQIQVSTGVSYSPPASVTMSAGVNVTFNPGAITSAEFQGKITRAQAIEQTQINNINAAATIRNLLLQEHQYTLDLDSSIAQGQLAIAGVQNTLARISRLIEDQNYYQTQNQQNWYYDPALTFEQEAAEIDYQNTLREYINNLYILSQRLAGRWSEPYENPYTKFSGDLEALDSSGLYDGFTQPESVFDISVAPAVGGPPGAATADDFLEALQAWDLKLHSQRTGGDSFTDEAVISLRRDVFGFSEVYYDTNCPCFKTDLSAKDTNVRRFRALLLRNAQPDTTPFSLRLEFPLTYNQLSKSGVGSLPSQPPVIPVVSDAWNIRIMELTAQITGNNVAQSANNRYRITLYQYGKTETVKFFPRQRTGYPNLLTYNLPLYYYDPAEQSTSPFAFPIQAGINGSLGVADPSVAKVEATPYCDRYVLLIERSANTSPINLQNVEDIILTLKWKSGIPPTVFQ